MNYRMKKAASIFVLVGSFLALFPLSWRLAEPLFTHPFDKSLPIDPVLLVCSDHVDILWFHDLSNGSLGSRGIGCVLNVIPERQKWVEKAVGALPTPNPRKASWEIHVKQIGEAHQQIDLELLGDGKAGLIYEAKQNVATPLSSRLTGPLGVMFPFLINASLWLTIWGLAWIVRKQSFELTPEGMRFTHDNSGCKRSLQLRPSGSQQRITTTMWIVKSNGGS